MPTNARTRKASRRRAHAGPRPTIGLLLAQLDEPYQGGVWPGVVDVAAERGVNLLCFAGAGLQLPGAVAAEPTRLYDLVSAETVDGLIVMAGALSETVGGAEVLRFCQRYLPLPMVSIALDLEGIPSLLVDNYKGMRDVIAHLIEVHGYSRLAFVRGPAGHSEADERYRAYIDVIAEHGLPFDLGLVVQGSFSSAAGTEAVQVLLGPREAQPEAIVCADDSLAFGVQAALEARGLRVPYDIAVAGFDDVEGARFTTPPLTTVRQPLYLQGRRAAEMLLAQLQGEECPRQELLPMELMVRQSCGCFAAEMSAVTTDLAAEAGQPLAQVLRRSREQVLAQMMDSAAASLAGRKGQPDPAWAERLLNALVAEVSGEAPGTFLPTLDDVLRRASGANGELTQWQGVLSALRRGLVSSLSGQESLQAEDLIQKGRILIGEMAQRAQAQQRLRSEEQAQALRQLRETMSTTLEFEELADHIVGGLPALGVQQGYIALYEGREKLDQLRIILAYSQEGRVALGAGAQPYPARELLPAGLWPEQRYTLAVTPLFFRQDSIGIALFGMQMRQGTVYGALQGQISSALHSTLLFRERGRLLSSLEARAVQLQTAAEVAAAASSILDPDILMQRVVDLVGERFGLYYAGLFLVQEGAKGLVMRAGSGEAGRQMVAQGQQFEVGGRSMVGWSVINKQPRVAGDVLTDPMYLAVPLLPHTRSEMAIPLMVGDRVIGALDVQSERLNAFTEEEVTVFRTMADQVAVAIENARVVEEMFGLNDSLQQTLETQARLMETIAALSTPVVPLMKGIILLPLVGNVDSGRSQQVLEQLLAGVQQYRAQVAILDITGVPVVDTSVANSLVHAARAVSLLGAEVVLVGIRPEVAQTMVTLGVDLARMATHSNLQNGIEYALWRLGFRIAAR